MTGGDRDTPEAIEAAWRRDPLIRIALDERRGNGVHPDHLAHMAHVAAAAVEPLRGRWVQVTERGTRQWVNDGDPLPPEALPFLPAAAAVPDRAAPTEHLISWRYSSHMEAAPAAPTEGAGETAAEYVADLARANSPLLRKVAADMQAEGEAWRYSDGAIRAERDALRAERDALRDTVARIEALCDLYPTLRTDTPRFSVDEVRAALVPPSPGEPL